MKLTFSDALLSKLNGMKTVNDRLILDLDDGIGPFSDYLSENGLKYRLLVVAAEDVPTGFEGDLQSNAGTIYFNQDTGRYLDDKMAVTFNSGTSTNQLRSDNALLEPNLPIIKAQPNRHVMIH